MRNVHETVLPTNHGIQQYSSGGKFNAYLYPAAYSRDRGLCLENKYLLCTFIADYKSNEYSNIKQDFVNYEILLL